MVNKPSPSTKHSSAARKDQNHKKTPSNPKSGLVKIIEGRRGRLRELRTSYRKDKRKLLSMAVADALALSAAAKREWIEFTKLDFWNKVPKSRPKEDEQGEAVRFDVAPNFYPA